MQTFIHLSATNWPIPLPIPLLTHGRVQLTSFLILIFMVGHPLPLNVIRESIPTPQGRRTTTKISRIIGHTKRGSVSICVPSSSGNWWIRKWRLIWWWRVVVSPPRAATVSARFRSKTILVAATTACPSCKVQISTRGVPANPVAFSRRYIGVVSASVSFNR